MNSENGPTKIGVIGAEIDTTEIHHDNEPIRNRKYKGGEKARDRSNRIRNRQIPWNAREFIAWDGEGIQVTPKKVVEEMVVNWTKDYLKKHGELSFIRERNRDRYDFDEGEWDAQPYVLLANSKGDRITNEQGLSSVECFEFVLESKRRYPKSCFVGFGFNYDIAQFLKDLPEDKLRQIYDTNKTKWLRYRITWRPRRWISIKHVPTGRSATIYDVIGFFQSSFLTACRKYFGDTEPDLDLIERGKEARDTFRWDELNDFIIPYNDKELILLVKLMDILRENMHDVGLDLLQWYGPGAVANKVLRKYHVEQYMCKTIQPEVSNAAQYAYAGGRFEQLQLGNHTGNVWEYDIRSAYPAAATRLPILSEGRWEFTETYEPEAFGIWFVEFEAGRRDHKPQPLFYRAKNGSISFPHKVSNWYWNPEAALVPDHIRHGYVWIPANETKPFAFLEDLYQQRKEYKLRGLSSERALKLALNSVYGKLAQTVGAEDTAPKWHQLEWAGWITSYVRSIIYKAILLDPTAIIATETDALFSTRPLDLPLGDELGQWELTQFKEILYLQSGFYYARNYDEKIVCRYRGLDKDRSTGQPVGLPYRDVLDHLRYSREYPYRGTPPLHSSSTRFINIGLSFQTKSTFRSWETNIKKVSIDQRVGKSKRYHMINDCPKCEQGFNLADCLHPMSIGMPGGESHPHPLPWVMGELDEEYENFLSQELADRWQ